MSLVLAGLLALSGAAPASAPPADAKPNGDHPATSTFSPAPPMDPVLSARLQSDKAANDAWMRSVARALRDSANPRDRALATQTHWFGGGTPTAADRAADGARLRAAAEAAPDDVLVQSLWAQAGSDDAGCDARDPCLRRGAAIVRVEPDNVVAWVPIVDAAFRSKDAGLVDSALAWMAKARRYDDHLDDARRAWMDVFARYPIPVSAADSAAAARDLQTIAYNTASAMSSSEVLPAFQPVTQSCRRDLQPRASPARFRDCAQVGRIMLGHADSQIGRMLGVGLLRMSGQTTPADVEMARIAEWQEENWFRLATSPGMQDPARMSAMVSEWKSAGNEIEVQQVELQRAGIPLTPPDGWQPHDDKGKPISPLDENRAPAKGP